MIKSYPIPGVYSSERDLSELTVIPGVNAAGIVLRASKGRINTLVPINSQNRLIERFGEPKFSGRSDTPEFGYGLYTALEYLKESDQLTVVRVPDYEGGDAYANAVISLDDDDILYDNISLTPDQAFADKLNTRTKIYDIDNQTVADKFLISCTGPGKDGNNIGVRIQFFGKDADWKYSYDDPDEIDTFLAEDYDYTDYTDEDWIENLIAPKVFKITVYIKTDKQTFKPIVDETPSNGIRERDFYVSLNDIKDNNNRSLFIKDIINGASESIYTQIGDNSTFSLEELHKLDNKSFFIPLKGGLTKIASDISGVDIQNGWDFFANKELIDVNILLVPTYDMGVKQYVNNVIILQRKRDCMMIAQSGSVDDVVISDILTGGSNEEEYGYNNPSYIGLYAGYGKIRDRFNDKFVFIPNVAFAGTAIARTANVASVSFAPAGDVRATVPSIEQNVVFDDEELAELFAAHINGVKVFSGTGPVIWGQLTALRRNSVLNRINARRTMLFIQNTVNTFLQSIVFNFNNTASTRQRVDSVISKFLAGLEAAEDIYGFKVEVVFDEGGDLNVLPIKVFVAPTQSVEFIPIEYSVHRAGVDFDEL